MEGLEMLTLTWPDRLTRPPSVLNFLASQRRGSAAAGSARGRGFSSLLQDLPLAGDLAALGRAVGAAVSSHRVPIIAALATNVLVWALINGTTGFNSRNGIATRFERFFDHADGVLMLAGLLSAYATSYFKASFQDDAGAAQLRVLSLVILGFLVALLIPLARIHRRLIPHRDGTGRALATSEAVRASVDKRLIGYIGLAVYVVFLILMESKAS